jgi:vacuolar-type H+-ATPase subunit I/STV1
MENQIGASQTEEKETPPAPPAEQKTPENAVPPASEGAKTQEKDDSEVPFHKHPRFQEICRQLKEAKEELQKRPEAKEEGKVAKQIETVDDLVNHVKVELKREKEMENKSIDEFFDRTSKSIAEVRKVYPKLTEDEIWDYMAEKNIQDVFRASLELTARNNSSSKDTSAKIGSGHKNAAGGAGMSYEQLHKLKLDDITLPKSK